MDKLTKAAQRLTKDEQFFYLHAGYSYDPKIETRDKGRIRCAKYLATAEAYARNSEWEYRWEDDWDIGSHKKYYGKGSVYEVSEPETCESCLLLDADGEVLESLGCIDDADKNYRRVIEAELASEAMDRELEHAKRITEVDQFIKISYAL